MKSIGSIFFGFCTFFILSATAIASDEPVFCEEQITKSVLAMTSNDTASVVGIERLYGNAWGTLGWVYLAQVAYSENGRRQGAEYVVVVETGSETDFKTKCKIRFRFLGRKSN